MKEEQDTDTREQRFIPAYSKNGTWHHLDNNLDHEKCRWWFKRNIDIKDTSIQTHLIPYNCDKCPRIMKILYAKYKLLTVFPSEAKEI